VLPDRPRPLLPHRHAPAYACARLSASLTARCRLTETRRVRG
jgi:hypothetical protein